MNVVEKVIQVTLAREIGTPELLLYVLRFALTQTTLLLENHLILLDKL